MNKKKYAILLLCIVVIFLIKAKPLSVNAASEDSYKQMEWSYNDDGSFTARSGKYYFKSNEGIVYISTKKNSGYKKTSIPAPDSSCLTNGKQTYYIKNNTIYRYIYSSGKTVKMKSLKSLIRSNEALFCSIARLYKGKLYIVTHNFINITYSYDIKSKKLRLVKKNCDIEYGIGNYFLCQKEYLTTVMPCTKTIYKLTSSGFKRVKKLGSNCGEQVFIIRGKLYYTVYPKGYDCRKVVLYRCNVDGTGKKKLATMKVSKSYTQMPIWVAKVTPKYCIYAFGTEKGIVKRKRIY